MVHSLRGGILAVFLLMGFGSFAQTTPADFCKRIDEIRADLNGKGGLWGAKFDELKENTAEFSELQPVRVELVNYIDDELKEVKEMEDVGGSDKLKESMTGFLLFMKNMITTAFVPVEQLSNKSSDEKVNEVMQRLGQETNKEQGEIERLNRAEADYAQANNFKWEPKKRRVPPPPPPGGDDGR